MTNIQSVVALYEALLHVLPPAFRHRFGAEMTLDLNEALARVSSGSARMAVMLSAVTDVAQTAVTQWLLEEAVRKTGVVMGSLMALWLLVTVLAEWQWPNGPSLLPVFAQLSCLSLPFVFFMVGRRSATPLTIERLKLIATPSFLEQ